MDAILKRVRMAEGQVLRRYARRKFKKQKRDAKEERMERERGRIEAAQQRHLAIKTRHNRWDMGPMAPNWDTFQPAHARMLSKIGAIGMQRARLRYKLTPEEKDQAGAWAGGATNLCLRERDRVIVIEGHYKNTIGPILSIDKDNMSVQLAAGVLKVNAHAVDAPIYGLEKSVLETNPSIPISAVRLVHPMRDQDGNMRDVVIRELQPVKVKYDRPSRTKAFARRVPGLNVVIPWPARKHEDEPVYEGDTGALLVDERTFVPTLLTPPFPEPVLDELRNKYSKYRVRHTPEFIAQVEAKVGAERAVKDAKKRTPDAMRTALQDFTLHQRKLRRALGPPVLTQEMLAKIGELIAVNKGLTVVGRETRSVGNGGGGGVDEGGGGGEAFAGGDGLSLSSQDMASMRPNERTQRDAARGVLQQAVEVSSVLDSTTTSAASGQRPVP